MTRIGTAQRQQAVERAVDQRGGGVIASMSACGITGRGLGGQVVAMRVQFEPIASPRRRRLTKGKRPTSATCARPVAGQDFFGVALFPVAWRRRHEGVYGRHADGGFEQAGGESQLRQFQRAAPDEPACLRHGWAGPVDMLGLAQGCSQPAAPLVPVPRYNRRPKCAYAHILYYGVVQYLQQLFDQG